jgi:small subunit ribosomal protein S17|tara:strand:+ start:2609 stop:2872 length:264 start_codon:yes stop_codon:yes gene_type:complete
LTNSGRRQLTGTVLTSKMNKTAVVEVTRRFAHPVYKKFVSKTKKYYADDPSNLTKPGDTVRIIESRQLSRLKRWRLVEVTKNVESLK